MVTSMTVFAKTTLRVAGDGRKAQTVEVKEALFPWFIDVRSNLKARLPKTLFLLQAVVNK